MNFTSNRFRSWCAAGIVLLAGFPATAQNIDARITADNAYRFGFGTVSTFTPAGLNIENNSAGDIFNCGPGTVPSPGPEVYSVPPDPSNYLYIVAYSDKQGTQGVLGQFQLGSNSRVFTDASLPWEVCAVGTNFTAGTGSGGPSVAQISSDIVACNAGNPAATSKAWVNKNGTAIGKLEFGEQNGATPPTGPGTGNEFPQVCPTGSNGIDPAAVWMWYNWDPANIHWPNPSPFISQGTGVNPDREYLIFRLPMNAVPGVGCTTLGVAFQYAAKFVCYRAVEGHAPFAHVRGLYSTAINVHSPSLPPGPNERIKPTFLAKKVAVALPGEKVGPVSPYHREALGPDGAFEIDCDDILRMANVPPASFLTGFVVIDSDGPLDVTAVYTARPLQGDVSTMDVEDIRERKVEGTITICP